MTKLIMIGQASAITKGAYRTTVHEDVFGTTPNVSGAQFVECTPFIEKSEYGVEIPENRC